MTKKIVYGLLVFLLFSMGCVGAPAGSQGLGIIEGFAAIVILLMIAVVTIAYMASQLIKDRQMEAWSKIELFELFISVLILLGAEGVFLLSTGISTAIVGGEPFEVARSFHSRVVIEGVQPAILYSYNMIMVFSIMNTFQIRPTDSVWTWTYKVAPGADTFVGMFNLLVYGLIVVMGSLNAHIFIIAFIEGTMRNFFLPAGVLLRFFPPTRKAGVFIIVLAIAFAAVYPTVYAMHVGILDDIAQIESCGQPGCDESRFNPFPEDLATIQQATTLATPVIISGIVGGSSKFVDLLPDFVGAKIETFVGFMASESFFMVIQPSLFVPVIRAMASLSLVTFFLPALTMVITIAFINGVTNFIDRKIM